MKLECKGGPDDLFLVERGNVAVLDPALPVSRRLGKEPIAKRMQRLFDRRSPGERQVPAPRESKGLAPEVREGDVGREPKRAVEAFEPHVV